MDETQLVGMTDIHMPVVSLRSRHNKVQQGPTKDSRGRQRVATKEAYSQQHLGLIGTNLCVILAWRANYKSQHQLHEKGKAERRTDRHTDGQSSLLSLI